MGAVEFWYQPNYDHTAAQRKYLWSNWETQDCFLFEHTNADGIVAAEQGRSLSAFLTEQLEAIVRDRKAFDRARRRALARLREGFDLQWTPPRSRDELHER
jgi:hypothetical protein